MSRLTEIYEGWKNVIFPTPEIEALAKERAVVCVECIHLNFLNVCSKCYCPKSGKAHSPTSRCPANKWPDGWGEKIEIKKIEHIPIEHILFILDENGEWIRDIDIVKYKLNNN